MVKARRQTYTDPTRKHVVRPGKSTADVETGPVLLGTFKQGYRIHDYDEWLIGNVEQILHTSAGELQIGSSGLLRGGAVAWVQFETPETHTVAGVDFRPFITAATSLDGSLATTYITGGQLVVCDNTLSAGLGSANSKYKVRHSSNSLGQIEVVRDALGLVFETTEDLMSEIYELANTSVSDRIWKRFLDEVAKVPTTDGRSKTLAVNKREALEGLWATDARVAPWKGTAYGVVAAMNTYDQHLANVRNISRPERNALNMVKGEFEKNDAHTIATLNKVLAKV
jgi:phage/plasmid-like protein (TIGR03299 family)